MDRTEDPEQRAQSHRYDRIESRPARAEDEPLLRRLFAESRPELAALPAHLVDMQYVARKREYANAYPLAGQEILIVDDTPVGTLLFDRTAWRLVDICLLPEFRGREIGTQVISALLEEAAAAEKTVSLHVAHNNPARHLYERLGFAEASRDEVYAEMMWRTP